MIPIEINSRTDKLANKLYENILGFIRRRRSKYKNIDDLEALNNIIIPQNLRNKFDRQHLTFKEIITGHPEKLLLIKQNFEQQLENIPTIYNLSYYYDKYFANGDDSLDGTPHTKGKINASWLTKSLNLKTCPYCNRNYINNATKNLRTSQLDHFFPKSIHKCFGLSFYNLIPSCYFCNHNKSEKHISVNPYTKNTDNDLMKFFFLFNSQKKSSNLLNFPFKVSATEIKEGMKENLKIFKIKELYEQHNDYIDELIKIEYLYNAGFFKDIIEELSINNIDEHQIRRILLRNYSSKNELHKRPLSKLTRDFFKAFIEK